MRVGMSTSHRGTRRNAQSACRGRTATIDRRRITFAVDFNESDMFFVLCVPDEDTSRILWVECSEHFTFQG